MPSYRKTYFDPASREPFKLSRSKIDLFLECPRCFYLDRRLGVSRPSMPAFTLNSGVDHLLKKEFDIHRAKGEPHPLMKQYGLDLVPFKHKELDTWRHTFTGVQVFHTPSNFLVFGAVDDVWVSPSGELYVVDYKATCKDTAPALEGKWQEGYKRQMEVYQWLLRGNGFNVSKRGYFVYVNGRRDAAAFDAKLEFDVHLIVYEGDDSWVERTLLSARDILMNDAIPSMGRECEHCMYREAAGKSFREVVMAQKKKETLF